MDREAGAVPTRPRVVPRWEGLDVLALSFVFGLPPGALFSTLRGEETEGGLPLLTAGVRADEPGEPLEALLRALGVQEAGVIAAVARKEAGLALDRARRNGIEALPWATSRYPSQVAGIFDPPLVLWVRGSIDVLSEAAVAIVGSRAASSTTSRTRSRRASSPSTGGARCRWHAGCDTRCT